MTTGHTALFVQGSTLRHIISTSLMGAAGLMTLFAVDLADLYFLSLLGETELAAAVGYAGTILFFTTSACIGIAIAMAALVARAIGAGERSRAMRYVIHGGLISLVLTTPTAVIIWVYVPQLVAVIGAEGRAHELATIYLRVIVPSMPVLALAMAAGGVLRATGAAKLAMYATIAGGLVNAVLDPFFIFTLDMGVAGAATASIFARFAVLGVGLFGVVYRQHMLTTWQPRALLADSKRFLATAVPAITTNLATPLGNVAVMRALAPYGDDAVAGYAIIGRLIPVAFGIVFALSGAVGPIVGQNFGAGRLDRVRRALLEAAVFASVVIASATCLLFIARNVIANTFDASPDATALITFFTQFVALLFIFAGLQFVANSAFNNLGKPLWSTAVNWGRATLGTLPFVYIGAWLGGAQGVLLGHAIGGVIFGTIAFLTAIRLVDRLASDGTPSIPDPTIRSKLFNTPLSAQSNVFGWIPSPQAWLERRRSEKRDR